MTCSGSPASSRVRHDSVPQVVKSEAGQPGRIPQRAPGRVPLARRLRRIELVMLARAPQIVFRIGVAEIVGAFQHPLDRVRAAWFSGIGRLLVSFLLWLT